jgi:hypothetical protein
MQIEYIELIKLKNNFELLKQILQITANRFTQKSFGSYWPDASEFCLDGITKFIDPSVQTIEKLLGDYRENEMLKVIDYEKTQSKQVQA